MAEVLPWIGNTMASARSYTWQILTSVVLGSKSFQFWGVQDVLLITPQYLYVNIPAGSDELSH